MKRRPDIFNQESFEQSLSQLGCPDSFIKPITSNFRLFVPIVLRELGKERLFEIVDNSRDKLILGKQDPAWRETCKYITAWAEKEITEYISQKD